MGLTIPYTIYSRYAHPQRNALAPSVHQDPPMEDSTMAAKICGCGKAYNENRWIRLDFVGRQVVEMRQPGEPKWIEWRNCPCGSTIGIGVMDDGSYTDAELDDAV